MTMRAIGIEIEVGRLYESEAFAALQGIDGLRVIEESDWINHDSRTYPAGTWKVTPDGSPGVASETVSPKMAEADDPTYGELRKVIKALTNAGAKVNRGCGGHIHIDAEDLTKKDIARLMGLWAASENQMFKLVAESRRHSGWCARLSTVHTVTNPAKFAKNLDRDYSTVRDIYAATAGYNRQMAINLNAYLGHNAVEFRLHQGTLNADKFLRFARLLSGMVDFAKSNKPLPTTKFTTVGQMIDTFLPVQAEQGEGETLPLKMPAEGTKAHAAFTIFTEGEAMGLGTTRMYDRCEAYGMPRHSARRWMNAYRKACRATTTPTTDTAANHEAAEWLKARPAQLG